MTIKVRDKQKLGWDKLCFPNTYLYFGWVNFLEPNSSLHLNEPDDIRVKLKWVKLGHRVRLSLARP